MKVERWEGQEAEPERLEGEGLERQAELNATEKIYIHVHVHVIIIIHVIVLLLLLLKLAVHVHVRPKNQVLRH